MLRSPEGSKIQPLSFQEKHSEEIVQGPPSSPEPNRRRSSGRGGMFFPTFGVLPGKTNMKPQNEEFGR